MIKRGQFLTSYDRLAIELNTSYKKIRTRLEKLEKTGEIVRHTGSQYTLITACNYDTYQVIDESEGRQMGSQRADGGQTEGRRRATTKNDKNNKNEKNNDDGSLISCDFDKFWDLYDKKHDKKKVMAKFKRLSKTDIDAIMNHLPGYIKATPDKRYRKNPLTYLNSETWNDEEPTKYSPLTNKNQYFQR